VRRDVLTLAAAVLVAVTSLLIGAPSAAHAADGVTTVCSFADERLDEISGMTYSQRHEGVIYVHNDSSGGPLLYAVDSTTCRTLATLTIDGIDARDLEAVGSGRDRRGRPIIWLADIGDNLDSWPEVRLHRVREPTVLRDRTLTAKTYRFTYSDRPHNAEAILADPDSTRVWVVTKQSARGRLYALPRRLSTTEVNVARPVRREGALVTDGSVSPDGSRYALRDYVDAQLFTGLPPGAAAGTVYLPLQLQGEAMTWTPDGTALLVAGERDDRLLRVDVPATDATASPASPASATPSPIGQSLSSDTLSEQQQLTTRGEGASGGTLVTALVAGGLLALAVLVVVVAEWRRRRTPPGPRRMPGES
jgi:hypothetical protein